jgi:hypothetical protein
MRCHDKHAVRRGKPQGFVQTGVAVWIMPQRYAARAGPCNLRNAVKRRLTLVAGLSDIVRASRPPRHGNFAPTSA